MSNPKIHLIKCLVIDFENISNEEVEVLLKDVKYVHPSILSHEVGEIEGEWDDDHPLNSFVKQPLEIERMQREGLFKNVREEKRFTKEEIIESLLKNKKKHLEQFHSAQIKFLQRATEELKKLAKKVEKFEFDGKSLDLNIRLQTPKSYSYIYDGAIKDFEELKEDSFSLSPENFSKYINDEWSWSEDFRHKTLSYLEGG